MGCNQVMEYGAREARVSRYGYMPVEDGRQKARESRYGYVPVEDGR